MSEINSSSSHRHDNRTELEKLLHKSKPWIERNGTALIYGLAAVLAIAAVVVFLNRRPQGDVQASQDLLAAITPKNFGNQKPGDFRDVADAFQDTAIGAWARLRQADLLLDNAISNMFSDRPVSAEELDQAQTAYERLANSSDISEEIRERVLIGLARLTEARCDGKPESTNAAVAAWKRVLEEFPASIVRKHAEERVTDLGTEEARSFYTWFAAQNPVPVDPGLEPGQTEVPSVPSHPSFEIPALPGGSARPDSLPKSESEGTGDTAKPDETGTDTTPDDSEKKAQADSEKTPGATQETEPATSEKIDAAEESAGDADKADPPPAAETKPGADTKPAADAKPAENDKAAADSPEAGSK